MLLELYDTYYLPLQVGLRPITKSFILALLPGLEEETGEFFEKVRAVLKLLISVNAEFVKGAESPGPPLQHRVIIFLPPKHLADNADNTLCSGNIPEFLITATSPSKR